MEMKHEALGFRLGEAVEFLINLLAGKELPSKEVWRLAQEAGILERTLGRAKQIVNAKSYRRHMMWYTSVPEEMNGRTFISKYQKKLSPQPPKKFGISSDWVSVVSENDDNARHRTDIPVCVQSAGLHVKIGAYEFKASADYPMEQLANLLRELGGEAL